MVSSLPWTSSAGILLFPTNILIPSAQLQSQLTEDRLYVFWLLSAVQNYIVA